MPAPYSLSSGLVPARSVPCWRNTRYCSGERRLRHSSSLSATSNVLPGLDDAPRPLRRPNKPSAMLLASPIAMEPAVNIARRCPRVKGRLVDSLAGVGMGAEQLRRRARDPAPHDAGQFVVAGAQPLRFALGDTDRLGAVPPHQEQRGLPDLALVGHHHDRKSRRAGSVPPKPRPVSTRHCTAQYLVIYVSQYTASCLNRVQAFL